MCDQTYSTVKALLLSLREYFGTCNGQKERLFASEIDKLLEEHKSQEPTPEQLAWADKIIRENYKPEPDPELGIF